MKKKVKIVFNAPVILCFGFICAIALFLSWITNGVSNDLIFTTYHSGLTSPMTYIRFVTHVFGHVNWDHFIGNMMYVLLLGPMLEEKYGAKKMLLVIFITAIITGLINYIFFTNIALCGASGVCFALILLSSFTGFREGEIPLTAILVAVIFLGQQVYEGVFLKDNISNMAHIIGGVVGGTIGFAFNKKPKDTTE